MAATQPRAWKHVIGVKAMSRKVLEVCFNLQDALHHIQTNGINTHNTHLTFTPDIPLVTTVSLWGIPIKMPPEQMNEHLQRYGEVKSSYQSRKNVAGNNILTGVRVYSIILKHPIPRNLQVGGMNIRTKYTGQDRHIQQERDKRQTERQKYEEERQIQRQRERTENEDTDVDANGECMTDDNTNETDRSLFTPDMLTEAMDTEIEFVNKFERNIKRKNKHNTKDESESEDPKKNKTIHSYTLDMDTMKLIIEKGGIDKLPTPPFTGGEWTRSKLQGLFYYLKEGSVLHTEWYVEDCPPEANLYDPEGYNCWKTLSALKSSTIEDIMEEWVYRFEDFLLYI